MLTSLRSEGDDWLFAGDVKYHLGTSQAALLVARFQHLIYRLHPTSSIC